MSCRHHICIILSFLLQIGILSCIKNKSIAEPELLKQENFETVKDLTTSGSDIITFHNYSPGDDVEKTIKNLKQYNRPIICTKWLNRPHGSTVEGVLPLFAVEKIECLHWGLVNGKTQTDLPWGHRPGDMPNKGIWQHDLYTPDLEAYSPYEVALFKSFIVKSKNNTNTK